MRGVKHGFCPIFKRIKQQDRTASIQSAAHARSNNINTSSTANCNKRRKHIDVKCIQEFNDIKKSIFARGDLYLSVKCIYLHSFPDRFPSFLSSTFTFRRKCLHGVHKQ